MEVQFISSHFKFFQLLVLLWEFLLGYRFMFRFQQLLKTAIFSRTASLSSFSQPVLLVVLHFCAVLVYAPFGVCSMWNIIRYGLFAVYEDPARVPAYCMIFLKFIRLWVGKIHFFRAVCFVALISFS